MKKLETRFVKYMDINFILEGKYYKGTPQTYEYPGDDEEFEVHNVFINDVNITDILSSNQINDLEKLALEN
jgi:hypothetical protein